MVEPGSAQGATAVGDAGWRCLGRAGLEVPGLEAQQLEEVPGREPDWRSQTGGAGLKLQELFHEGCRLELVLEVLGAHAQRLFRVSEYMPMHLHIRACQDCKQQSLF